VLAYPGKEEKLSRNTDDRVQRDIVGTFVAVGTAFFAVGVYTQSFSGLLGVETEYLFINELKISHDIDKYFFSNCFEQLNLAWQFASLSSWAWQFLEHRYFTR